jgi:hypothetical protein
MCNEEKEYTMPCGHTVLGLCGEEAPNSCIECKTGCKPLNSMISLACGHNFQIGELDRHVGFLSIDNNIAIKSAFDGKFQDYNLTCPICGDEIEKVERYSVLKDIRNLSDNVDRLISEIGHKIAGFGKSISFNESQLHKTFQAFCDDIRPNPLAASENRRKVQERGRELMEVQDQIAQVKSK